LTAAIAFILLSILPIAGRGGDSTKLADALEILVRQICRSLSSKERVGVSEPE
jgi:hypothetical protein